MATYYPDLHAARLLDDADRSGLAADDTDVTGHDKTDKFILALQIGYNNKDPLASAFKLQWRDVTDSGSFADVGATGEIKYAATSAVLTDGTQVTSTTRRCTPPTGQTWQQIGEENVNDNVLPDSGTIDINDDSYTELQFALDPADAEDGHEYEFRLWNTTEGAATGTALCTITMADAPVEPNGVILVEGFEHGTAFTVNGGGLCSAISGSPAIESSVVASGDYSAKFVDAVGGVDDYIEIDFPNGITATTLTMQLKLYVDDWIDTPIESAAYISLRGTHETIYFMIRIDSGPTREFSVYSSTGGTTHSSGISPVEDTFYTVDIKVDIPNGTTDWRVGGVAQTQRTGESTSGYFDSIRVGVHSHNQACAFIIDDIVISDDLNDYPFSQDLEVIGLSPNADGSHNAGTNVIEDDAGADIGAVTAYDLLNEVPLSGSVGYIRQAAIGTGNYAEVNFTDVSADTVYGAQAFLAYGSQNLTEANSGACIVEDEDTTETEIWGTPAAPDDYSDTSGAWWYKTNVLPEPSGGWDQAAVNALHARVGYSSDATPYVYWGNLLIQVAYVPAAATRRGPSVTPIITKFDQRRMEV